MLLISFLKHSKGKVLFDLNIIDKHDYGPFSTLQKLAISRIFHHEMPGYWFQFSTSNNTISLYDH